MGKDRNPAGDFLTELLAHGFTYCLFQAFNFRPVIIGSLKAAEVGSIDRPEPPISKNFIHLIQKQVCHEHFVAQVMYLGRFSMMAYLAKI
jgi:hypothetical protein